MLVEQLRDIFGLNIEYNNEQVKRMVTILAGFYSSGRRGLMLS